ncbi:MAG: hypothetical protein D6690_17735 [Nitrospirae bacterium]|nr:MAG: hypothetical protein D6690_17735 [Nitrospirota bacterium]
MNDLGALKKKPSLTVHWYHSFIPILSITLLTILAALPIAPPIAHSKWIENTVMISPSFDVSEEPSSRQ